jgi:photoactive yellow protein
MSSIPLDFSMPRLAEAVERLSAEQVDALPFGAILLDPTGAVVRYSNTERQQSGFPHAVEGRLFFTEIAPCMNTPSVKGRIERAMAAGLLDIEFEHIGDFTDPSRSLFVRIQSAASGGYWIFINRDPSGM